MIIKAGEHGLFPIEPSPGGIDFREKFEDSLNDIIGDIEGRFMESEIGPQRAYFEAIVDSPEGGRARAVVPYKTFAYKIVAPFHIDDFDVLRKDLIASVLGMTDEPSKFRLIWRMSGKVVGFLEHGEYRIRTRAAVVPTTVAMVV